MAEVSVVGRKVVVLGVPWDSDTDGLREYMDQFGPIDDIIVMKDRATGKSRGFGYVTFATAAQAEKVVAMTHTLKDRRLEVKMATPKEDMKPSKPNLGTTRIFVARISQSISDDAFKSYFEKFGVITDAYMPKDPASQKHRGIGFVTFETPGSVDKVMAESHEINGTPLAVDRANPKEEGSDKRWLRPGISLNNNNYGDRRQTGGYGAGGYGGAGNGAMDPYAKAYVDPYAASYAAQQASMLQQQQLTQSYGAGAAALPAFGGSFGGGGGGRSRKPGSDAKVFIGKLPADAGTAELREYFERFGPIEDIYIPKDASKSSHRGFGFVTFLEEEVAAFVAGRPHEICGRPVFVDRATPQGSEGGSASGGMMGGLGAGGLGGVGGGGGPIRGGNSMGGAASLTNNYYGPGAAGVPIGQLGAQLQAEQLLGGYGAQPSLGGLGAASAYGSLYSDYAAPGTGGGDLAGAMMRSGGGRPQDAQRYRPY